MTLAEMRTMARMLLDDTRSAGQRWTDAQIVIALNSAARYVSQLTEANQAFPRLLRSSVTLSIVAGTTEYSLGATFVQLRRAVRTDVTPNVECVEVSYSEAIRFAENKLTFDGIGRPLFYLDTNASEVPTFNLCYDPNRSMTIVVTFQKIIPSLTTSSDDANSYAIPAVLHDMVVLYAVIQLLSADAADASQFVSEFGARRAQLLQIAGQTNRVLEVVNCDGIT